MTVEVEPPPRGSRQPRGDGVDHRPIVSEAVGSRRYSAPVGAMLVPKKACQRRSRKREHTCDQEALRVAYCPLCRAHFAVCRSCDHGRLYCSPSCSTEARRASLRAIRRRYRHSAEGRDAHRRQEQRRRQHAAARARSTVGDQPSSIRAPAATLVLAAALVSHTMHEGASMPLRCCRCGKSSDFIVPKGWRPRWLKRLDHAAVRSRPSNGYGS